MDGDREREVEEAAAEEAKQAERLREAEARGAETLEQAERLEERREELERSGPASDEPDRPAAEQD